jgi:hypothetical protein
LSEKQGVDGEIRGDKRGLFGFILAYSGYFPRGGTKRWRFWGWESGWVKGWEVCCAMTYVRPCEWAGGVCEVAHV